MTKVPFFAIAVAVSACGGSGGGGPFDRGWVPAPGTVTDFQGPLTDVSSPVTVAPRYSHIQFDGVQSPTTSSGPNSPGGFALDIDPVAGTVTVQQGPSSPVFDIDFDDDTRAFDSDSILLNEFTHRATMLIPGAASGYQHTSYGVWSRNITSCLLSTCGSQFYGDAFYFGWPTGSSGIPGSGEATYTGTMRGYHSPFSQSAVSINGDATLVANFTNRDVTGSFHDITTSTILGSGVTGFGDIQIAADISGGRLSGTVTGGAGGSGTIDGRFFGPSAQELGGTFRMTGNGHTIGAFAAKQ